MKYLIAVHMPTGTEIFEFPTDYARTTFINSIMWNYPQITYATSEVESDKSKAKRAG